MHPSSLAIMSDCIDAGYALGKMRSFRHLMSTTVLPFRMALGKAFQITNIGWLKGVHLDVEGGCVRSTMCKKDGDGGCREFKYP